VGVSEAQRISESLTGTVTKYASFPLTNGASRRTRLLFAGEAAEKYHPLARRGRAV